MVTVITQKEQYNLVNHPNLDDVIVEDDLCYLIKLTLRKIKSFK